MDDGAEYKQTRSEATLVSQLQREAGIGGGSMTTLCVCVCVVMSCCEGDERSGSLLNQFCDSGRCEGAWTKGNSDGSCCVFYSPDPSFHRNPFKIKLRKNKSELVPLIRVSVAETRDLSVPDWCCCTGVFPGCV